MPAESGLTEARSAPLDGLSISALKGVGPRIAERLKRLGITTIQDLLFHLPSRYEDRTRVTPIGALEEGRPTGVIGEIQLTQARFGRRRALECLVSDGTGKLSVRFFHFRASQQRSLARGARIYCFGDVRGGSPDFEMIHPEYRILGPDEPVETDAHLTPHYPTTEGLNQLSLRRLTGQALRLLARHEIVDCLPGAVLNRLKLPPLAESLTLVHRPPPDTSLGLLETARHPAQRRLAFEELLAHHLSLRLRRRILQRQPAISLSPPGPLSATFLDALPFSLTEAQQRVVAEIRDDLVRPHPMHRLLQGDVGAGKTVVAALAALQALESGCQATLMAPTELLAEQHRRSFKKWLSKMEVRIGWLSGKQTVKARRESLDEIANHRVSLVIGTHALFQQPVTFSRLGLVIVDEQHRFGVHQRLSLLSKGQDDGNHPHQLIMTATPIPRTLAMAAYADLDTSIIDDLPPGRQPVQTAAVPEARREEVMERVHQACLEGQQVYWVCTLIEESEALQCQAADDAAKLLTDVLPDLRIGLIHGRMKTSEKDSIMSEFRAGRIDVLVATTVVEVGVDVANASLMVIENAERLGLAQLHQLRGRVGRGARKSVCVLMYRGPLSASARQRLNALRETNDGFEIARRDLALRGPGEVLGTRQTGTLELQIADLVRDQAMLPHIEATATQMLSEHPQLVSALIRRWIGNAVSYADV